jgi:hypothetical protein
MKKTSPQLKLILNDYVTIIRKNADREAAESLTLIMANFAEMNNLDVNSAIELIMRSNPMVTLTPGKSEFKIEGFCQIFDAFYGHKHYKSLLK